jgi:hypothetical protein
MKDSHEAPVFRDNAVAREKEEQLAVARDAISKVLRRTD